MIMKVRYDPKADAMYIDLVPDKKSTRTEELREDILLDYNGKELVGIEILDASDKLTKKSLSAVSRNQRSSTAPVLHAIKHNK